MTMSVAPDPSPASEIVTFWNDTLGPKFNRFREILMNGLSGPGDVALEAMRLETGWHVLDVGCGWGDTAMELARRVGPSGRVVGIDCTASFIDIARADSREKSIEHLHFEVGDVEIFPFEPVYDAAFSRFGTMFFNNPVAAMRNVRKALKPGAVFHFVVWRSIADNPWLGKAKEQVLRFLPAPGDDAQTCGPGPFSMADTALVTQQMEIAGYTDITFTRVDTPVNIGSSIEEAVQFQLALGPAGEAFREAGAEAERQREAIEDAMRQVLGQYLTGDAVVMDASAWAVTAHNPS